MFYVALEVVTVGRWYRCECLIPFKHLKKTDKLVPRFGTNANNYLNLFFALIIPKRVKRPWAQVACGRLTSLPRKKKVGKKMAAQNFRSKKCALWWSERCVELRCYNSTTAHSTRKCGVIFGVFFLGIQVCVRSFLRSIITKSFLLIFNAISQGSQYFLLGNIRLASMQRIPRNVTR